MKIKFNCGCSVKAGSDGYGGIDATELELCPKHLEQYRKIKKK